VKLFVFPIAPNPTRVRLYLAEKRAGGAKLDVEEVSVNLRGGEQRKPEHLVRNPFGRLPVLALDDGSHLTESLAIIEYLEELVPEPALIGCDARERARVRELERVAELGVLVSIAKIVHATRSPLGLPAIPEVAEHFRGVLAKALEVLEAWLADDRPFIAGARVSIADITLAAAFQFGRLGGVELDPGFTRLARWDRDYRARATARAVLSL